MFTPVFNVWTFLQKKLDSTPMYKVVSSSLLLLASYAIALGWWGILPYTEVELLVSLGLALVTAFLLNTILGKLWRVTVNTESAFITAVIVFFLVIPAQVPSSSWWLVVAATGLAILSKFVIVWRGQHLLNPAATGTLLLMLAFAVFPLDGYFEATWWVGQRELLIPLIIVGAVVVAKIRKWVPVGIFLSLSLAVYLFEDWRVLGAVTEASYINWLVGPSLFLAFFMLTEPFTIPPTTRTQIGYALLLGFISQTTLFATLGVKMSPELALLIGNLCFFPYTLRQKLTLVLREQREVAENTYEFIFNKPTGLLFKAGQYMEWMLPHRPADGRGMRRYFTIASAPSSDTVRLSVRYAPTVSTYKQKLKHLQVGETIIASQRAGDFTLPKDQKVKIACIAGGIGITPFMSQFEEMSLTHLAHNSVLFYCNNTSSEIAYKDSLASLATTLPLTVVHVLAKEKILGYEYGYLTADVIQRRSPDFLERTWYVSGPPGMVQAYKKLLHGLGIKKNKIICDFFPGLA